MKRFNKFEVFGFAILLVGFILFILANFTEIEIISRYEKVFFISIFVGLLIQSYGMIERKKAENNKKK